MYRDEVNMFGKVRMGKPLTEIIGDGNGNCAAKMSANFLDSGD
jgi:hypothetical protein